jgi:hypothetical protein
MWAKSVAVLGILLLCVRSSAESESGTVCIAPFPEKPTPYSAPPGFLCGSEKLSLKIDERQAVPWPIKDSLRINSLDLATRHRVIIFCDGKPQQSFTFHFSEFGTKKLCLFINDFYKTAQLWEDKQSPWCKCK